MNLQNVIDNNTLVILGICGFLTVCFGLLVLAFSTIFRFTGRNFMGFLGLLVRNQRDVDKDDGITGRVQKPNLRRIADEDDFNAALAKHIVTDQPSSPSSVQAQNLPSAPAAQNAPGAGYVQTGFTPPPASPPSYNTPLSGTPKAPTVLPGYLPGTGQAINPPSTAPRPAASRPAVPPPAQPPAESNDLGWENPSLRTPTLQDRRREEEERNEEDDLLGGLLSS